jgi:hypothetical protein
MANEQLRQVAEHFELAILASLPDADRITPEVRAAAAAVARAFRELCRAVEEE